MIMKQTYYNQIKAKLTDLKNIDKKLTKTRKIYF